MIIKWVTAKKNNTYLHLHKISIYNIIDNIILIIDNIIVIIIDNRSKEINLLAAVYNVKELILQLILEKKIRFALGV